MFIMIKDIIKVVQVLAVFCAYLVISIPVISASWMMLVMYKLLTVKKT